MTKTLTEQWREGTLPDDTYYWKVFKENWIADKYEMYDYTKVYDVSKIKCLAPVPSYDEFKQLVSNSDELVQKMHILEKQLAIATKALEQYANSPVGSKYHLTGILACIALKEMEGVK